MWKEKMEGKNRSIKAKRQQTYKYGTPMALLFTILVLVASCGQAGEHEVGVEAEYETGAYTVHTIELVVPQWFLNHPSLNRTGAIRTAERTLDRQIRPGGERFHVNIIPFPNYGTEEAAFYVQRKELRMMAGQPYDVFLVDKHQHNIFRYAQNGFLADIYALIDESPNAVRGDFFTNVLDAFTIGGNLYTFPLNFKLELIGINADAPQELVDEFSAKTTVTLHELMSMYLADSNNHWYISCGSFLTQREVFPRLASDFVSLSGLTSSLNQNSFINALSMFQEVQQRNGFTEWIVSQDANALTFGTVERASNHYLFASHSYRMDSLLVFLEPLRPNFVNVIPVSDEIGQLHIGTFYNFAVANTSQASLAWEFLNLLVNPLLTQYRDVNNTFAWNPLLLPIRRAYAEEHISSTLDRIEFRFLSREGPHEDVIIVPDAEARLEMYSNIAETFLAWAEMPMAPVPMVMFDFLQDDIDQLLHGILTPEEAALRMHNRVVLWLIE